MIRRILNKIESIYKYRYLSRNEKGAYKFLLTKVHKSTDIDFIERVWQLDFYREILEPSPLVLKDMKRVLILAPHQDDELLGCGGTLLQLSKMGCEISIGFLTNGAEISNPEESVPVRHNEAEKVCAALGAEMIQLGIDNVSLEVNKTHVETLSQWLDRGWDAVFAVWPVDQPPKHRLCSYIFGKALSASNYQGPVNLYAVHTDLLPNFYADISDEVDQKQKLLSYYDSQIRGNRLDHLSKGLDAWRSRFLSSSGDVRYIETYMQIPAHGYVDFQNIYENTDHRKLFKGHENCIRSFLKLRKF